MNVGDHAHLADEFVRQGAARLKDGSPVADETVIDGIQRAVDAFLSLMRDGNTGKILVRVSHS
ncbi:hypothetical protein [Streptomyces sp. NPDC047974]|uniref:hypothetical protein n=1 Tax=Streptomyces sp. NPDC047974 TaxID=3154343 RepID=UPI0033C00CEA